MIRRFVIVGFISLFILLGCWGYSTAAINLLLNGNIERFTGDLDVPPEWNELGLLTSLSQSGTQVKYGKNSLAIENNTGSSAGAISSFISISPCTKYTFEAYTFQSLSKQLVLYVRWYDSFQSQISSVSGGVSDSVSQWKKVSVTGRAPENAVYARTILWHYGAKAGISYADGVSFSRAESQSLIDNEGFEANTISTGVPIGWEKISGLDKVGVGIYDNEQAIYLDDDATESAWTLSTDRFLMVKPNMEYKLSAKLRTETLSLGGRGAVSVYFYDKNKTRLTDYAYNITATSGSDSVWETQALTFQAPSNSAYAKVLLSTYSDSIVKCWFDDIKFEPEFSSVVYMSYQGFGNADGSSVENAADVTDSTAWSNIADSLDNSDSVKVVLIEGDYNLLDSSKKIWISSMNSSQTAYLLITGENIYGTNLLIGDGSGSNGTNAFRIKECNNTIIQNIHFTNYSDDDNGYFSNALQIYGGGTSKNITIQGCSFIDLTNILYGAVAMTEGSYFTIKNCEFIRIGTNYLSHCIYAQKDLCGSIVTNNYFEDCSGEYVRFRNRCSNTTIMENEFVSTGEWYRIHSPFVEPFATANDVYPGDESFGDFGICYISNNIFEYLGETEFGAWPVYIVHMGYDPDGESYLLNSSDKTDLTSGDATIVADSIYSHYGIKFGSNLILSNNIYSNEHAKVYLKSKAAFEATSLGGCGYYNLDIILQ